MSTASATLDRAFTDLLGKVRSEVLAAVRPPPNDAFTINCFFSGGGSALPSSGLPGLVEVPAPCAIIWADLFAGSETLDAVAVTASVDVRVGSYLTFPASTPVYVDSPPSLTAASYASIDISTWLVNFVTSDVLTFRLISFTGSATWLALVLGMRRTGVEEGLAEVVDAAGNTVVDGDGNTVVYRQ